MTPAAAPPAPGTAQATLDELGSALVDTTFVVVDLETTGGSPATSEITEIGAVKVRGGVVLGEFASLVRPGRPIPPLISVLTGITDAMVADAPPLAVALPALLGFTRGAVLVAHNAPFDLGFLRAGAQQLGLPWPGPLVVDTARLARRVVTRDETPDCRLASLARLFRSSTQPCHRALADARATVDVLHGLLERLGGAGVRTVEELQVWQSTVTAVQRRQRSLAEEVPSAPGVYLFHDAEGRVLYVGRSTDLRRRVRSYFTASETRRRIHEMLGIAASVTTVVCQTALEAEVRELRLIAQHVPRYNRRSTHPERSVWVTLTAEPFPRLSVVRQVRGDPAYLGPFASRRAAEAAVAALHDAVPLRQCTSRLSPRRPSPACVLAEIGRCRAPCRGGSAAVDAYAALVRDAREAVLEHTRPVAARLLERIERLAAQQRYEEAAAARDRATALVRAAARGQRLRMLAAVRQLVAARRLPDGGWEVHVVRHGRLAAAARVPPGAHPRPVLDAAVATAETVLPRPGHVPAATPEEAERLLLWLDSPGVRLVDLDGVWASPAGAALGVRGLGAGAGPAPRPAPGADPSHVQRRDGRALRPSGAGAP